MEGGGEGMKGTGERGGGTEGGVGGGGVRDKRGGVRDGG